MTDQVDTAQKIETCYQAKSGGNILYLLDMGQVASSSNGPWGAVYLSRTTPLSSAYTSLHDLLQKLKNPNNYTQAGFLWLPAPPINEANATVLMKRMDTLVSALPADANQYPATLCAWFPKISATVKATSTMVGRLRSDGQSATLRVDHTHPLQLLNAGNGRVFSVPMPNDELYLSADVNDLVVTAKPKAKLLNIDVGQTPGSGLPALQLHGQASGEFFRVPLIDSPEVQPSSTPKPKAGVLYANATTSTAVKEFQVGLQVSITELASGTKPTKSATKKATKTSIRYPLLAADEKFEAVPLDIAIDPLAITDISRTRFTYTTNTKFKTGYRSLLGNLLQFQAQTDTCVATDEISSFVFYQAAGGKYYLGPAGKFVIVDPAEPKTAYGNRLVCGLTGVEYFPLSGSANGDIVYFLPSQPATATRQPQGQYAASLAAEPYTTSWLWLGSDNASIKSHAYIAEPASAPAFHATSAIGGVVNYQPLTRISLPAALKAPAATSKGLGFPMLPYGAMVVEGTGGTAAADESSTLSAIESQVISRERHTAITRQAATSENVFSLDAAASGYTVTPQGIQFYFVNGEWRELQLAVGPSTKKNPTGYIGGKVSTGHLSNALQSAMLASQQFFVVSIDNGNLGNLSMKLSMAGWTFDFAPPKKQTVGAYRNVLLIKSCNDALLDLIANPEFFTSYADFNDAKADPSGQYLSRWMQNYCAKAIASYKSGVLVFEDFVNTIRDPHWNGFIALNVVTDLGDLDSSLDPLLGGINLQKFATHHVGNEATRVHAPSAAGQPFELDSAMFALIHYVDPNYKPGATADYRALSADYDFTVLNLTAVFRKSGIESMNCKLLFSAATLFDADVINNSLAARESSTNSIIIDGTVQKHDGVAVYTFATPNDTDSLFSLSAGGIKSVDIHKLEFAVFSTSGQASVGNGKTIESRFSIWGDMAFSSGLPLDISNPDSKLFDILSYEQLGFSGLAVDMTFVLSGDDVSGYSVNNRTFKFNAMRLQLADSPVAVLAEHATPVKNQVAVRTSSLMAQYPLKLNKFTQGPAQPASYGFGPLSCPPLDRANAIGDLGDAWYGLEFSVELGSMGALAPNVIFTADLLFAWSVKNGTQYTGIKLPGLGPLDKLIDIEGVIKFGAKKVYFDRVDVDVLDVSAKKSVYKTESIYVLNFASIGLHVLSLSFPAAGSTTLSVFGDPHAAQDALPKHLGWFGSYVKPGLKDDSGKPPRKSSGG